MASKGSLIQKIADYLQKRDKQTNFGVCRRCKEFTEEIEMFT